MNKMKLFFHIKIHIQSNKIQQKKKRERMNDKFAICWVSFFPYFSSATNLYLYYHYMFVVSSIFLCAFTFRSIRGMWKTFTECTKVSIPTTGIPPKTVSIHSFILSLFFFLSEIKYWILKWNKCIACHT